MEIRFANKNDANKIAEVYHEWSAFKGSLPNKLIKSETKEEIANDISNKNRKYLVAIINNQIVGVCYIETSFIELQTVRLGDMIVKKDYRQKGIASALIEKIKEFASENNIKKIWLWTQKELIGAIKCYEKNGFKLEGIQKSQFCGKDALIYGLIL
ncbi:MAG: GNAT family N-acetyltransferase [Candidatus Aenigmarchaeota archaeon]|nr:GNAT family N-acetyltransferase [Candidatus Aenigmarchaeota archaeon]